MNDQIFSALIPTASAATRGEIAQTLGRFGESALRFAAECGIRVVPLREGERYEDASPALTRLNIQLEDWPVPPAGLFVVEERSVYLRSRSPMTTAHEFGHALDCALGDGMYYSGVDAQIRRAFAEARAFVTPYAATGLDEYFAESVRSWVGVNDSTSPWPRVSRARLLQRDPHMHSIVRRIFAAFEEMVSR